ncbi:MAG TPA: hypothetical protein VGK94_01645 [Candidatus Polarisedimenticolia bacterium]
MSRMTIGILPVLGAREKSAHSSYYRRPGGAAEGHCCPQPFSGTINRTAQHGGSLEQRLERLRLRLEGRADPVEPARGLTHLIKGSLEAWSRGVERGAGPPQNLVHLVQDGNRRAHQKGQQDDCKKRRGNGHPSEPPRTKALLVAGVFFETNN